MPPRAHASLRRAVRVSETRIPLNSTVAAPPGSQAQPSQLRDPHRQSRPVLTDNKLALTAAPCTHRQASLHLDNDMNAILHAIRPDILHARMRPHDPRVRGVFERYHHRARQPRGIARAHDPRGECD
ncbi:uncharacterized protein SCHCODRAFT_02102371 [Schizophyllum commune H4-8]|uniref:uncharacterized protein n=1 Tax=Schizophyllum commune (strain H4-8 / FGSC 9210) TaxID=578458 RepID=UPI00215F8E60|nr:uncharacterized protein SCHCODRAFT_02102371 [Schizophyllum commune H4-8]KAI5886618.1 hypothetical protein SCHCODRAFT_02102371 [Schizophyllum commune H4-8]